MYRYLFICFCILFCNSCKKEGKLNYEILRTSTSKNLVFVDNGSSDIMGIDTVTFTVEVQVRVKDITIGGVCQLPQGGIAFTYYGKSNNNTKGKKLYITDEKYKLKGEYSICVAPMAPKVINNVLMVGSSVFEEGRKMKFQLYNTDNFTLMQEYLFEDMIDGWIISPYNTYAYFGVDISPPYTSRKDGYLVELNLITQNVREISFSNNAFFNQNDAYSLCRNGSLLYVFQRTEKNLCVIDLNTNSIDTVVPTGSYSEIVAIECDNIAHPVVIGDYIYAFLRKADEQGYSQCFWIKLNASTFALESVKELKMPGKVAGVGPAFQFIAGRFLVTRAEKYVLFTDIESGEVVQTVCMDVK